MTVLGGQRLRLLTSVMTVALGVALLSCGGRQAGGTDDPIALLRQGLYKEARAAARKQDPPDQTSLAIVALTYIAEKPLSESGEKAVAILTKELGDVRAAAAATEMLGVAFELPEPVDPEVSLLLAEAALGAASYGPFAPATNPSITVGAASRDLALSVLERVGLALSESEIATATSRLLTIWNSCFSLTAGSFEARDTAHAWRLFLSISRMALFVSRAEPGEDLANVLLNASVTVIEANRDIVVAARCDLASPYEALKKAMAYNRGNLARLEKAVADAAGCTRGIYAPESQ
jgi:hypothetical protein